MTVNFLDNAVEEYCTNHAIGLAKTAIKFTANRLPRINSQAVNLYETTKAINPKVPHRHAKADRPVCSVTQARGPVSP